MHKAFWAVGGSIILLLLAAWALDKAKPAAVEAPEEMGIETSLPLPSPAPAAGEDTGEVATMATVASGLNIPWEIAWLPDGAMLVTQRPGQLIKIKEDRQVIPIEGVAHRGEGGLLGLALHPNFANNDFLYLYLTSQQGGGLINRVERYRLEDITLTDRQVLLDNIPGSSFHDGGRIKFGPDGKLYITTGDAGQSNLAQERNSLAGKILRLNDDGSIPADNPLGTAIYSYGHRNVQGITWDNSGRLWATEHGRSGLQSGMDELNLIEAGANYGWPTIEGDETAAGLKTPVINSGARETWAPSGAVFHQGSILFAGLRGETLYEAVLEGTAVKTLNRHFPQEFGRLRTVAVGPDGWLYVLTNNRDGRGTLQAGDDKIIRLDPSKL